MTIFPRIKKLMTEKGVDDILLFGGGIIPQNDIEELNKIGIGKLFTPGATTVETVEYVKNWVEQNRKI
jgi:methylmalonyl-CoA mutase C-terminal domain/subunit